MPETETVTGGLLRAGVLSAARADPAARLEHLVPDPRAFLAGLVRRGWLTPLQARWAALGGTARLAVGRYILLDRLGAGGMGQVFLARHRGLGREAAVKVVRADRRGCALTRARFAREVRAIARLNHTNVVHAFDAGTAHGSFYLAMEYVPGPDLGRGVVAGGPLDPGRACEYVRQAAVGLQHVHDQGLVHRDIKPANLGLAADGRVVKVLDVGLARIGGDGREDAGLTGVGRLIGSPDYAAPEQIVDARRVDPRADVYALGCSLYHLLTGEVPFPGGSPVQKAMRHLSDTPRPVGEVRPGLPAGLEDVVRRMTARRRRDRFRTMADVLAAMAPFAAPVVGTARAGDTALTLPAAADLPTRL
ncbi:MAG: prkC 10 [Gemmataceae bacterium]|nr:prkC 10 [Gemmataceae bacterium]